ncbi:hypothetical protein VTK26DRAFT_3252 [Humicola hyalothermophila]
MFPEQQQPDHHRKRCREDEDVEVSAGGPMGFTEHRSKRLQCLPIRMSERWNGSPSFPPLNPTFAVSAPAQNATPDSSSTAEPRLEEHMWADEPELVPPGSSAAMTHANFDTDMDMGGASDFGDQGQRNLGSAPFRADPNPPSVTGRIPTPIHCSFAAQIRGNNWHGEALATTPEEPNSAAFGSNGLVDITRQGNPGMAGHENVSRPVNSAAVTAQVMADWSLIQDRRLPSPISECGTEDADAMEASQPALDLPSQHSNNNGGGGDGGPLSHLTHQHPLLAGLPPRASSAAAAAERTAITHWDRSGTSGTPAALSGNNNNNNNNNNNSNNAMMDVESSASPKRGHTRSKHTLSSWTSSLQPGMKRSFSIGYRADCEKCRMKVPGHFNHIIIS